MYFSEEVDYVFLIKTFIATNFDNVAVFLMPRLAAFVCFLPVKNKLQMHSK